MDIKETVILNLEEELKTVESVLKKIIPLWKECPECGGAGQVFQENPDCKKCGEYKQTCEGAEPDNTCALASLCQTCQGLNKAMVPIYYAPEQWEKAGCRLEDDTPVWCRPPRTGADFHISIYSSSKVAKAVSRNRSRYVIIIAHPEQPKPSKDWRPE